MKPDLIAATGTKERKSAEEIKAVKLANLEKARGAKASYKKADEEAKAKGEIPPSITRSVGRDFPIMFDEDKQVRLLNLKEQLWDTKVNLALPQLLYYTPELWYQYLELLGGQPQTSTRHRTPMVVPMEIDKDQVQDDNFLNLDTSTMSLPRIHLQSVFARVAMSGDLEFLLDTGAIVSVILLHIANQLGKGDDIHPTNRSLRFGGGEIDLLVGVVKLKLQFAEDVTISHTFCVTANPSTPLILGMDFIYAPTLFMIPGRRH